MTNFKLLTPTELREIFPTQAEIIEQDEQALSEISMLASKANESIDAMITELTPRVVHRNIVNDCLNGKIVISDEQLAESESHLMGDHTWMPEYTNIVETAVSHHQPITGEQFLNCLRNIVYRHLIYGAGGDDIDSRGYITYFYMRGCPLVTNWESKVVH